MKKDGAINLSPALLYMFCRDKFFPETIVHSRAVTHLSCVFSRVRQDLINKLSLRAGKTIGFSLRVRARARETLLIFKYVARRNLLLPDKAPRVSIAHLRAKHTRFKTILFPEEENVNIRKVVGHVRAE